MKAQVQQQLQFKDSADHSKNYVLIAKVARLKTNKLIKMTLKKNKVIEIYFEATVAQYNTIYSKCPSKYLNNPK